MRLQRLVNRKVGDKTYYKWILNIPPAIVDELDWRPDEELTFIVHRGALEVRRRDGQ